jgi:uncharacterized protein
MLQQTFLHVPGVGEKTEQGLWQRGIRCWQDALASSAALPARLRADVQACVAASLEQYAAGGWRYFDEQLPAHAKWRAAPDLVGRIQYVDIETNGYDNEITVIGIYDGNGFRAFVAGENLEDALPALEEAAMVVTFNGARFDMPLIRQRFPYHLFNHVHLDVMWPLKRLGYRGGLKRIERQLGLARSEATETMDGWDAVLMWREYQRGSSEALQRLLQYNEEDVRNLEPLLMEVLRPMRMQCGAPALDQGV